MFNSPLIVRTLNIFRAALFSFLMSTVGLLQAGDIRQFEISVPEKVLSGQEVEIAISGLDADKKAITRDSRAVEIKISNGGTTTVHEVSLRRGKASVKHVFLTPGAALITVLDPSDAKVVDYKSFVVDLGPEVLK